MKHIGKGQDLVIKFIFGLINNQNASVLFCLSQNRISLYCYGSHSDKQVKVDFFILLKCSYIHLVQVAVYILSVAMKL